MSVVHRPSWFTDDQVFVSFAETVGINKDGNALYRVDSTTGKRTEVIDDRVEMDISALLADPKSRGTETSIFVPATEFSVAVPTYYDNRHDTALAELLKEPDLEGFSSKTLGELVESKLITEREGHGSPSQDLRAGSIPYIKVSDVRAGQVNINPSNLVPRVVAQTQWHGKGSGLHTFDLITPMRASKNIGEFAILMPGQEEVVLTKEFLILRSASTAPIDNFYLLWALSLKAVRDQWKRIVFMQTNREDVGNRYLEIEVPWPPDEASGRKVSEAFRTYYLGIEKLRKSFVSTLEQDGRHHVFLGSFADVEDLDVGVSAGGLGESDDAVEPDLD